MGENKGFSLIEVIVVIALIVILASFGMYNVIAYRDNLHLKNDALTLKSRINDLRQATMSRPAGAALVPYQISFSVGGNQYTIQTAAEDATTTSTTHTFEDPRILITSANFDGNTSARFLSRGIVNINNNGSIILANARGSTSTITVGPNGKVSIENAMN